MGEASDAVIQKLADAISALRDNIRTSNSKDKDQPAFDVKVTNDFLAFKKDSIKNRRDRNEIQNLQIIFKFYDQLEAPTWSFSKNVSASWSSPCNTIGVLPPPAPPALLSRNHDPQHASFSDKHASGRDIEGAEEEICISLVLQ